MTELQDNTTEMQSKHTASQQTKKAKGSALDRGFPTGIVLIVLVILIIALQVFSAFKVMNLDAEYADLEKSKALFKQEKKGYEYLKEELPSLRSERNKLNDEIPGLKGIVVDLEKKQKNLLREKAEAEAIIAERKKAEEIHTALKQAVDSFKKEVENKTSEIMRLSGPNSQLQNCVSDLRSVVTRLDTAPKKFDKVIVRAEKKIGASLDTINRASASLESGATDLANSATSTTTVLQNVSSQAGNAIVAIQTAERALTQETTTLSQCSSQLQTAVSSLGNNISDIATTTQQLSGGTATIRNIDNSLNIAIRNLKNLSNNAGNLSQVINGHTDSLNQNIRDLSQHITSINTAETQLQTLVTTLQGSANNLSQSISQVQNDADNFEERLQAYDPAQLRIAIQGYNRTISDITNEIQTHSNRISTMRSDIKDKVDNLIKEIESLNELLIENKKRLRETSEVPSAKTAN